MASIAKRPNGQWRARYRDEHDKEHARHFPRKVDAQRWLDSVTASVVRGDYVDPDRSRLTFAQFYAEWATGQVWATGTRRAMDLAAGDFTAKDRPLKDIRTTHVQAWVKAMVDRGLASGTIHTRVTNVRGVLRAAVEDRRIVRDPSSGVTLPRQRRREAAMAIPKPAEVGALLADDMAVLWGVCAFAGLRLGEAAALRPEDIDVKAQTITVERQVQRETGGGVEIKPPKYGSERVVYIPARLVTMLTDHLAKTSRTEWVFADDGQQPPHQNTVGHWWRRACAAHGVKYRLHDLRHFYASGLIAAGCDVVTVQRALGHAKATTTLTTYAHLWPTAEDRTRKAASDLLADSLRTARGLRAV
ncbi:tyrosine-type recombinase/integrase [Monashia sp. NPDC004114]